MPVHDMTKRASTVIGEPATGSHARCRVCGYGTVIDGAGAAILVHSAICPEGQGDYLVACRWTKCKAVLDPARVAGNGATTCNERHRAAAWKAERQYGRHDQEPAEGRANGSQKPRKVSGLQVSYRAAVGILSGSLQGEGWGAEDADTLAEQRMRGALSDRQRAQLEARER